MSGHRSALEKVQHVRCIFGTDDGPHADRAVEKHITDNALGDRYSEEMIATVGAMHIELKSAPVSLSVVEEVVELVEG